MHIYCVIHDIVHVHVDVCKLYMYSYIDLMRVKGVIQRLAVRLAARRKLLEIRTSPRNPGKTKTKMMTSEPKVHA